MRSPTNAATPAQAGRRSSTHRMRHCEAPVRGFEPLPIRQSRADLLVALRGRQTLAEAAQEVPDCAHVGRGRYCSWLVVCVAVGAPPVQRARGPHGPWR